MSTDGKPDGKPDKGELRRRWKAMLEDGTMAALRSEGRLAALYVLYAANWTTCEVRCSMRRAAKAIGVQPTTIRRGIAQMVAAGIMEKVGDSGSRAAATYVIVGRAQAVRTPDTSGAQPCARPVRRVDTSGAQTAHTVCAERARPVRRLRTLRAHSSVITTDSSYGISGGSLEAPPSGGVEPPSARQEAGSGNEEAST